MEEKRRVLVKELPWSAVLAGEFGLYSYPYELEVDGDKRLIRIFSYL